jgi:hypothetical protein
MRNFRLTYAAVTENVITWNVQDLNSKEKEKNSKAPYPVIFSSSL